ncbi:hypothetical protein A4A49_16113 [Nicotiana attenuata]|uniref:Uncharacterized protein n=1 Tax=Nicotiana attenuata TaxID=49451 RepID=A0A314KJ88_NICAT|nr:hypothetical protein A4A49_16113 [Nicotiana attenuata]
MDKLDNAYGPVIWTKVGQAIGPGAKPRYGQGIRQPNDTFAWDSVELRRFRGGNPEAWVLEAERYFEFYSIADEFKLSLASCYLDGEALAWFQWLYRNKQFVDWKHFTEKLKLHYRKWIPPASIRCSTDFQFYSNCSETLALPETYVSPLTAKSNVSNFCEFESIFEDGNSEVMHMFDELPTKGFPKAIEEIYSFTAACHDTDASTHTSHFAANLEDNHSPKIFDKMLHSCFPNVIVEAQSDAPINDEEARDSDTQWFSKSIQRDFLMTKQTEQSAFTEILPMKYEGIFEATEINSDSNDSKLEEDQQVCAMVKKNSSDTVVQIFDKSPHRKEIDFLDDISPWISTEEAADIFESDANKMFDKVIQRNETGTTLITEVVSHANPVFSQEISMIGLVSVNSNAKVPILAIEFDMGYDFSFDPGSGAIPLIRVQSPQRRLEDHFTPSNPSRQHLTKHGGVSKYMLWFQHDINAHIANWFDTGQRPKASKFSLDFLVIILLDRCVYGKVSWLDNGRGIFDDMIYRNMLTVLESFVPPTTVYSSFHEILLESMKSVQSSKLALALTFDDVNSPTRRGAIRPLRFAYVSASYEQICSNATLLLGDDVIFVVLVFSARILEMICGRSYNRKSAQHIRIAWIHQNGSKLEKPFACLLPFDLGNPYFGQQGRAKVISKSPKIITTTTNMLQGRNREEWMTWAFGPQVSTRLVLVKECNILLCFISQAVYVEDQHVIGVYTHLFMLQDLTGTLIKKVKAKMILVELICRTITILLFIPVFLWLMKYSKETQYISHHAFVQNEVHYAVTIVEPDMNKVWYGALNFAQKELACACHLVYCKLIEIHTTIASLPKAVSLVFLNSNFEDKVLIEEGSIVVNMDKLDNAYGPVIWTKVGQAIGPGAKPRYGQGMRLPNDTFAWNPG